MWVSMCEGVLCEDVCVKCVCACEVCMRVCEVLIISPQHFHLRSPSNLWYGAYQSATNTLVQCMKDALQGTLNTVEEEEG